MILREPKSVVVTPIDLWAIQKFVAFHAFMLDPRTGQPIFPMKPRKYGDGEIVNIHTAWSLREKVNRLLLRMADEPLPEALLYLDYDECWFIDSFMSADSYQGDTADDLGLKGSKRLLIGVFRCLYEHENMVTLAEGITGAAVDQPFEPGMIAEYLQQAQDKTWKSDTGPEAGVR